MQTLMKSAKGRIRAEEKKNHNGALSLTFGGQVEEEKPTKETNKRKNSQTGNRKMKRV